MPSAPADLAILLAALVGATLIAELLGAENLGTALTFGQIAFMAAVLALMVRSARPPRRPER